MCRSYDSILSRPTPKARGVLTLRKGLYRLVLKDLGDCARTSYASGDAAPFLDRATYERLKFHPPFDALPSKREYIERGLLPHPVELRCEDIWSVDLPN